MADTTPLGLTQVPTEDLKTLLHYLHQGEINCPVTPSELARIGLQDRAEAILSTVRGLDASALRAVLVAVIAERLAET